MSTIIPVRNRPRLLREAVASVLAQTYRPIEVIIVDDGSTDETPDVAAALAAENPDQIRVIRQGNSGPGVAREAGRLAARGEFIQYLDSDDVLLPMKFALQVAGLCANPQCGVSYGYTRHRHADGTVDEFPWGESGKRHETMFPSFLRTRGWDTATALYRASLCSRAGPWSNLWHEEDWEYDCRIAALGVRLHQVPQYVVEIRTHSEGHLSREHGSSSMGLGHRAAAHCMIFHHAMRGGIGHSAPEMQHFARELFSLARQCGAAGLAAESRQLFFLSREASGPVRSRGLDFRLYWSLAAIVGWTLAGRLACAADGLRRRQRAST